MYVSFLLQHSYTVSSPGNKRNDRSTAQMKAALERIVFCLTYGAAAEKAVHIKDNTLVNAVAGGSAVNGPG